MLQQDDVAVLADVVKNLSEQLQQVQRQFQLQLVEQQATITEQQATIKEQQAISAEQARQIDALTRNVAKQDEQVDRLAVKVARQEAEHKVIAALQENGTGCCMSALIACKAFSIVLIPAKYIYFKCIARSLNCPN